MTEGEWVPAQPPARRIEADGLSLRWWEPGDVAEMLEVVLASQEHLRAFLPWATGYSAETADDYLDRTREGVATRAAAALTRAALDLPDVDRVEIHHDAANQASAGVPRRLGYTRAGEYGRAVRAPGQTGRAVRWVTGTVDVTKAEAQLLQ